MIAHSKPIVKIFQFSNFTNAWSRVSRGVHSLLPNRSCAQGKVVKMAAGQNHENSVYFSERIFESCFKPLRSVLKRSRTYAIRIRTNKNSPE